MRSKHLPEEPFHILAAEVSKEIDCTTCANCCRMTLVSVTSEDVKRIAGFLECSSDEVIQRYTSMDLEVTGGRILRQVDGACIFLRENRCTIYEARPKPCRDFPHTEIRERSLGGRMASQCLRASICPIVYNTLERYKRLVGYRPRRDSRRSRPAGPDATRSSQQE
jgi:Predicted Fe-S-cluster oxidoreductase